jgi:hypothetical protein
MSRRLSPHQMLLLTLLFLGAAGLRRTWDKRGYTGRKWAYGYRYTEEFSAHIAHVGTADRLTDTLAYKD